MTGPAAVPHVQPEQVAREAVGATGTCSVCGREVALRLDGLPKAKHNRTVVHNPDAAPEHREVSTFECHGSRFPPVEYVAAFEAARSSK